jgi:hypothetical protein
VESFTVEGISGEEARIIETLIRSYIADLGNRGTFVPADAADSPPDYTLSGSIAAEEDNWLFKLSLHKTGGGELHYTSVYKTMGELALKAKTLVEAAFVGDTAPLAAETAEPLTEAAVAGTWRGDQGIRLIRLERGGRGIAFFSSGTQMQLMYEIEDNTLKVRQDCPNTERFYHPLPYAVAKQVAAGAEPMRWEFLLFNGGLRLRGVKVTTAVRYEGNNLLELLPGTAREAEWIRAAR